MKFINAINQSISNVLKKDKKVIFYGEDLDDPYGGAFKASKGLSTAYPNQVISTPISEAAMIGISGGMSIGGLKPLIEIMFSDFLLLGGDQLLNHLVKYEWMYDNKVKTPVTIRTAIGGRRGYGPTHSQSIEPILSSIPGLKIISPTYYHDVGTLLEHCILKEEGIKIFCEYKMNYTKTLTNHDNCPQGLDIKYSDSSFNTVYLSNCEFDNPDLTIISHGGNMILIEELMLDLLIDYELNVNAVFPSQIKPLPIEDLISGIENSPCLLFIEESPKNFGWSGEVIASLQESNALEDKRVLRIGAEEKPIPSAIQLEERILPSKHHVISSLKQIINF